MLLLEKFKWGHSFFKLNGSILDEYCKCKTASEVIKTQEAFLQRQRQEDEEASANYRGRCIIESLCITIVHCSISHQKQYSLPLSLSFISDPTEIDSDEEFYNPNRNYGMPPSERYVNLLLCIEL